MCYNHCIKEQTYTQGEYIMFNSSEALYAITLTDNGTNRLVATIGAKNFCKSDKDSWVSFRFTVNAANKANYFKLTLNDADLYDVEFGRVSGNNYHVISKITDMCFADINSYFEDETKLHLSL